MSFQNVPYCRYTQLVHWPVCGYMIINVTENCVWRCYSWVSGWNIQLYFVIPSSVVNVSPDHRKSGYSTEGYLSHLSALRPDQSKERSSTELFKLHLLDYSVRLNNPWRKDPTVFPAFESKRTLWHSLIFYVRKQFANPFTEEPLCSQWGLGKSASRDFEQKK